MSKPVFSIIIPVLEINYYIIFENLPAFEKQTFKKFEVIIVPNEHTQYDITLLKKYSWLRIIPTGKITRPAQKRDIGVKEAKGKIIAFIDDDAYPSENWLETANKHFTDASKKVVAFGGPGVLPPRVNDLEKAFDEVFKTWIGSGGFSYRFKPGKKRFVDDYPSVNFFIKKDIFQKLGGFNSEFWPGEDSKLCEDIVYKLKKKIQYDPEIIVYHHRRTALKGYLKQHGNYGFHRGAFFAHGDKNSRRLTYLIPTFFLIYLLTLIPYLIFLFTQKVFSNYLFLTYFVPLVVYKLFCLYLLIKALISTRSIKVAVLAPIILFFTHITYGTMFIKGFVTGRKKKDKIYT